MISLLVVIYIIFISLGLPDSLFGVAWPVLHLELNVPESFASIYSIIIGCCTGGVSFVAGKLIRKFGTSYVTVISIFLTIVGIVGISFSNNIYLMMIFAIILGWGAGAIDSGLNNFVSLHYKTIHMNFLHAFWGIGVTISPIIMSYFLNGEGMWRIGYRVVAVIQSIILIIAIFSLKNFRRIEKETALNIIEESSSNEKEKNFYEIFKIKGVIFGVLSLGFYCGMEFLLGTWGASFLVNTYSMNPSEASMWVSLYYGGIMAGRIVSGLASSKIKDKYLVISGICIAFIGIILLLLPLDKISIFGLLLIGFGFGPVFPNVIHMVPERFGKKYSPDITGYHMGGAYFIGFLTQLTYGYVATSTTFKITPYVLITYCICLFIVNMLATKRSKLNLCKE